MTAKKVLIGGFGSSEYQVNWIANKIAKTYDEEVIGVTFVDTMNDPEMVAGTAHRHMLLTHSAGMLALDRAMRLEPEFTPDFITAIAPPIPTKPRKLVAGAIRTSRTLLNDTVFHPDAVVSNSLHAIYMIDEVRKHLKRHVGAIPRISQFDSIKSSQLHDTRGVKSQIIMMNNDEFFYPEMTQLIDAKHNGVDVRFVRGEHGDFICRPLDVMRQIAILNTVTSEVSDATTSECDLQLQAPAAHRTLAV